jgi:hypothetical protein
VKKGNTNMQNMIKSGIMAGIVAALLATALPSRAGGEQYQVVVVGGNASIKLIQALIPTNFGGHLINATAYSSVSNSLIFSYTNAAYPSLANSNTTVRIDFNLTGGAGAARDLANQNLVALADGTTAAPNAIITAAAPEDDNISEALFTSSNSIVVPVVYIRNTNFLKNSLALVTNITQRNAVYLAQSGGFLPTGWFSGDSTHLTVNQTQDPVTSAFTSPADNIFFVGRNSLSAVQALFDFNTYNTAGDLSFSTNSAGQPEPYPLPDPGPNNNPGASAGSEVVAIVKAITNSIGTVAVQDAAGYSTNAYISYEGVPFSVANVANGSYPLWGYERYITITSGAHAPTTQEATVLGQIYNVVQSPAFQTNSVFTNIFVGLQSLTPLGITRTEPGVDGTAILSTSNF